MMVEAALGDLKNKMLKHLVMSLICSKMKRSEFQKKCLFWVILRLLVFLMIQKWCFAALDDRNNRHTHRTHFVLEFFSIAPSPHSPCYLRLSKRSIRITNIPINIKR
jgi:hypothetical protein